MSGYSPAGRAVELSGVLVCEVAAQSSISLPASPQSAALARRFVREAVCPAHESLLEDAQLLASETVANAAVHGGPPIVLSVHCAGDALEVRVRDGSPVLPQVQPADELAEGGRGLMLVELLAADWGIHPVNPASKEVWFRLTEQ